MDMGGTNALGPFKSQEPLEMTRGASTVRPFTRWHTVKGRHLEANDTTKKKNMSGFI